MRLAFILFLIFTYNNGITQVHEMFKSDVNNSIEKIENSENILNLLGFIFKDSTKNENYTGWVKRYNVFTEVFIDSFYVIDGVVDGKFINYLNDNGKWTPSQITFTKIQDSVYLSHWVRLGWSHIYIKEKKTGVFLELKQRPNKLKVRKIEFTNSGRKRKRFEFENTLEFKKWFYESGFVENSVVIDEIFEIISIDNSDG